MSFVNYDCNQEVGDLEHHLNVGNTIIISCDRLPVSTSILARCQYRGELFFYIPLVYAYAFKISEAVLEL
ncbi:MAG: hypothetical protein F6K47_39635 [Symploca sp. SIO2E6]|nr:hypothetical protein [Symploca sp. SIO2E6]